MNKSRLNGVIAIILVLTIIWTSLPGEVKAVEIVPGGVDWEAGIVPGGTISVGKVDGEYTAIFQVKDQNGNQLHPALDGNDAVFKIYQGAYEYGVSTYTMPDDLYYSISNISCDSKTISGNAITSKNATRVKGQGSDVEMVHYYTINMNIEGRETSVRYHYMQGGEMVEGPDDRFTYGEPYQLLSATTLEMTIADGYYLAGWAYEQDGPVVFKDQETIRTPKGHDIDSIVVTDLYAILKKKASPAPAPAAKASGSATVTMKDYYVGNTSVMPAVSSTTNDAAAATLSYKLTSAPDSTYTSTRPSAPGSYTVRAVLPENSGYSSASATATFGISYLPFPADSIGYNGEKGNVDETGKQWYSSKTTATAPLGYKLGRSLLGRFTDSLELEEGKQFYSIYYMNAAGEKTTAQNIECWVDSEKPTIPVIAEAQKALPKNEVSDYAYFGEQLYILTTDDYLQKVEVNGSELIQDTKYATKEGESAYPLTIGKRLEEYKIVIEDEAGNKTEETIKAGPSWLMTGVIPEGEVYLEGLTEYELDQGNWKMDGDSNSYSGGNRVFVAAEGDYSFSKLQ